MARDCCAGAICSKPHGMAATSASSGAFGASPPLLPWAQRLLGWRLGMRVPAVVALCCLLLARVAPAGSRPCGNDVDGRGTAVACDCGDVLVSGRTLGDADPI